MGMKKGLDLMPSTARRQIFNSWKAPYELTSVQAGDVILTGSTLRDLLTKTLEFRRRRNQFSVGFDRRIIDVMLQDVPLVDDDFAAIQFFKGIGSRGAQNGPPTCLGTKFARF